MNDEFFYLMPGDCSFAIHLKPQKHFQLPLKHYHGIRIGIDLDCMENPLMMYAENCGCSSLDALHHICGGMSHIVLRSSDAAQKFFNDLYEVDFDQRLDYLRVKMPELFYRMKYAKTDSSYYDRNLVPRSQVEIVKSVSDYITENLNGKITVKQLTSEFGVSDTYADLEEIAPVVYLAVDYEKGIVESTRYNAQTIAAIFGKEDEVDAMLADFQPRIDALNAVLKGKNVLLGMYNANALGLMGTASQLNLIARELGANNLSESVGEAEKATHGEEASWETIITLNPEYMFILDRSTATGATDEGVMGAREVIENELVKELDVYKNGNIVYFIDHENVWYTSTGGVQALNTMLADLEGALLKE